MIPALEVVNLKAALTRLFKSLIEILVLGLQSKTRLRISFVALEIGNFLYKKSWSDRNAVK